MKQIISIILTTTVLLVSAGVHAQDNNNSGVSAGITPTNKLLYRLDILSEDTWQNFLGLFGSLTKQAQLEYLEKRIQERESEVWEMAATRGALSDEAQEILKHKQDHRLKATEIANEKQDDAKIREIQEKGWKFDFDYAKYVTKQLDEQKSSKDELHDEIISARKTGDTEKLNDLVLQMNDAQRHEGDLLDRNKKFIESSEATSEKIENILTGAQKAELLFGRIEQEDKLRQEKKTASDALWKKLLKDLDLGKKEMIAGQKAELEKTMSDLQKLLRDIRTEEEKKVAAELAKEDEEAKQLAAPPELPVAKEKTVLKKIQSETVKTSSLQPNTWYHRFGVEAGTYIDVTFDATGGLPPYHYQLESGSGFPPIGIILDANGRFSGTPKVPGAYTFKVCVVDMAGDSNCPKSTMYITGAEPQPVAQPEPAPQPDPQPIPEPAPAPEISPAFSIASASCQLTREAGADSEYTVNVSGTASGPVGARLSLPTLSGYTSESWTSSWGNGNGSVEDRGAGDPENTNWTSTLVVGRGTKTISGYVRVDSNKSPDSRTLTCE